jgi:uncharacterized protein YggE
MRRTAFLTILTFTMTVQTALAQIGGNAGYAQGGGRARAEQNERAKRQLTREELPPTETSMFLDASVLMNVKADEYVATFGVAEEGQTVEACQAKMNATIGAYTESLKPLGLGPPSINVDFTAQTKIYDYKLEPGLAREELTGFEMKKTVAVRFRDKALLDALLAAASRARIHDLIKVDYVVTDPAPIHERLAQEAAAVIKAKAARHERLLGTKLRPGPLVYAERSSVYHPTEMYDSYTAAEFETVPATLDRSRMTVHSLRKSRTFYYNPLGADGFDRVINPVVLEPVVQFTHYLKVKYSIDPRP